MSVHCTSVLSVKFLVIGNRFFPGLFPLFTLQCNPTGSESISRLKHKIARNCLRYAQLCIVMQITKLILERAAMFC